MSEKIVNRLKDLSKLDEGVNEEQDELRALSRKVLYLLGN